MVLISPVKSDLKTDVISQKTLFRTLSYCESCCTEGEAEVIEKDGKVYANVRCKCGTSQILLENNSDFFKKTWYELPKDYKIKTKISLNDKDSYWQMNTIKIFVTHRCNSNCSICLGESGPNTGPKMVIDENSYEIPDMDIEEAKAVISKFKNKRKSIKKKKSNYTRKARIKQK